MIIVPYVTKSCKNVSKVNSSCYHHIPNPPGGFLRGDFCIHYADGGQYMKKDNFGDGKVLVMLDFVKCLWYIIMCVKICTEGSFAYEYHGI